MTHSSWTAVGSVDHPFTLFQTFTYVRYCHYGQYVGFRIISGLATSYYINSKKWGVVSVIMKDKDVVLRHFWSLLDLICSSPSKRNKSISLLMFLWSHFKRTSFIDSPHLPQTLHRSNTNEMVSSSTSCIPPYWRPVLPVPDHVRSSFVSWPN